MLVWTVAATTGSLLSMASKDRTAALGLPAAPERALGWLLGGRDGRLLLVAVGAVLANQALAWASLSSARRRCFSMSMLDRLSVDLVVERLAAD
jgi:hypothetical protein